MKPKLIPVDRRRCQAIKQVNNFMTLGGVVRAERCENRPSFIAKETKPGKDGCRGSMSLCADCAKGMKSRFPKGYATLTPIKFVTHESHL